MLSDTVSLSIAPTAARVGACELCLVRPETLKVVVVVRHARGGTVEFAACERCAAASRRLIAAAGGGAPEAPASTSVVVESAASDLVGSPVVIHQLNDLFVASDGVAYTVSVVGQQRADGMWLGWLIFSAHDGQLLKRTSRETTQSSRDQLEYWANGLQPSYIQGSFDRAT